MAELAHPSRLFHRSFIEAAEEIVVSADDDHYTGLTVIRPIGDFPGESFTLDEVREPRTFAAYTTRLINSADPRTPLPAGIVHSTHVWWVEGDNYLGRASIRHSLTPWLREFGGHIGYVVRPSARRRGHATQMLAAVKPVAARLGIDSALVTCDDTNVASRRVIEANGGVFEDQRGEKLRFWMPTTA